MPPSDIEADDGLHDEAWALIPWLVNETLDDADTARVAAHVDRCPVCAAEVRAQRRLMQAVRETDVLEGAADRNWNALHARLAAEEEGSVARTGGAPASRRGKDPRPAARRRRRWAVASALAASIAAMIAIAVLGSGGGGPSPSPRDFRTLTTPETPGRADHGQPVVRVLAAKGSSPERIGEIAREAGLRVASGPSERGVYTLVAVGDGPLPDAVAALEARPEIEFASIRGGE